MKTILVDDEPWSLERFEMECGNVDGIEIVGKFRNPLKALEYAEKNHVDLAFLDVEMPYMNGLDLSEQLRRIYPPMIVIFVSAYEKYVIEALRDKGADYYVLKPYSKEEVESVIKRAQLLSRRFEKRIYIETFGHFGVYIDGKPVKFTSQDARELLALTVHKRGTILGNKEAFYMMWEDRFFDHSSAVSLYKAQRKLKDTLEKAGIGQLFISVPNGQKLNVDIVDCDYYQFLEKSPIAIQKFLGEYMPEWTWGEETTGLLVEMTETLTKNKTSV